MQFFDDVLNPSGPGDFLAKLYLEEYFDSNTNDITEEKSKSDQAEKTREKRFVAPFSGFFDTEGFQSSAQEALTVPVS